MPTALAPAVAPPLAPPCCLSIDVEDYYHIEAAYRAVPRGEWDRWPPRVEANVDRLLELFARHQRPGTFFILGDVARRFPALAPRIAAAGHEIASHGTGHDRLHRLSPQSFRDDLLASKRLLEDQTGRRVLGYRAPTFSVTRATAWAIDVLAECGFAYDASIFPVTHPAYGVPEAPAEPYRVRGSAGGATVLELPPLTWRAGGRKLAVAGGGYFRLLPLWFMKKGLDQARAQGRPAILYFHPWEFDPALPRMPLSLTGRLRTYTGLKRAAARLQSIMAREGPWTTLADSLPAFRQMAEQRPVFTLG